jgi:hypothetical protein
LFKGPEIGVPGCPPPAKAISGVITNLLESKPKANSGSKLG